MHIKLIFRESLCKPQLCIWTERKAVSMFGALGKYVYNAEEYGNDKSSVILEAKDFWGYGNM